MTENKDSKNRSYLLPLAFALCICGGLWLGSTIGGNGTYLADKDFTKNQKIRDILTILDTKYVDSINGDKVFEKAIGDMLHQLDPHSNYISASDLQSMNESIMGEFYGIGIRFFIIRDTLCVTNVINNSPSMKAGLESGDKILKVNDKSIVGKKYTTDEIMGMLKGAGGTRVKVTISRNGKKLEKSITRDAIPLESIPAAFMINANIGYIKIDQFSQTTGFEFKKASNTLLEAGMTRLILDLRDNGGGVLGAAVDVCDEFLKEGLKIVSIKGEHLKEEVYRSTSSGKLKNIRSVVLINSNSASASEIVAGALQDNDRATIMGRRSFGKGLVQEDFRLRDGSNIRLTIARYYTPTGRCIQKPYSGSIENYYQDQLKRAESGELFVEDTLHFVDSLKYKTPKGKTVYGGGGIMPDVFIPYDTLGYSGYYNQLRFSSSFQIFSFDYVSDKRNKYKTISAFNKNFTVDDALYERFVEYVSEDLNIDRPKSISLSTKQLIKQTLKSEIARQIWIERGYYEVQNAFDFDIRKAVERLK